MSEVITMDEQENIHVLTMAFTIFTFIFTKPPRMNMLGVGYERTDQDLWWLTLSRELPTLEAIKEEPLLQRYI